MKKSIDPMLQERLEAEEAVKAAFRDYCRISREAYAGAMTRDAGGELHICSNVHALVEAARRLEVACIHHRDLELELGNID